MDSHEFYFTQDSKNPKLAEFDTFAFNIFTPQTIT